MEGYLIHNHTRSSPDRLDSKNVPSFPCWPTFGKSLKTRTAETEHTRETGPTSHNTITNRESSLPQWNAALSKPRTRRSAVYKYRCNCCDSVGRNVKSTWRSAKGEYLRGYRRPLVCNERGALARNNWVVNKIDEESGSATRCPVALKFTRMRS